MAVNNILQQGSAYFKGFGQALPYVFLLILLIIGMMIGGYYYLYRLKMNITTIIFSKRGTPTITMSTKFSSKEKEIKKEKNVFKRLFKLVMTRSGFFKIKGDWFYKLQNPKVTIPCPSYEHLIPTRKGNILFLKQESMDDFIPLKVKVEDDTAKFVAIPEDIKLWSTTMKDRLRAIYSRPSFMERYGAMIMIVVAGGIIIILIGLVLNKFDVLDNVAKNLATASKYLKASSIELPPTSP